MEASQETGCSVDIEEKENIGDNSLQTTEDGLPTDDEVDSKGYRRTCCVNAANIALLTSQKETLITSLPEDKILDLDSEKELPETEKQVPTLASKLPECCYKMDHPFRGKAILIDESQFTSKELDVRYGSYLDRKRIETTLKKLGFQTEDIHVLIDADVEEIMKELQSVSNEDHTDNDMFVCVIMTHGESGMVHATDKTFMVRQLWEPFTEDNCPSLANKPKIFFIQACRGESDRARLDPGVEVVSPRTKRRQTGSIDISGCESKTESPSPPADAIEPLPTTQFPDCSKHTKSSSESEVSEPNVEAATTDLTAPKRMSIDDIRQSLMAPNPQVPLKKHDCPVDDTSIPINLESAHDVPDMMVAYSTIDGHYSFRNENDGSWFIQTVCDKLKEFHATEDLMSIMTHVSCHVQTEKVSRVMAPERLMFNQKKQAPCIASTLTKLLFFSKMQQ